MHEIYDNKKRAIIISIMIILLCLTFVVGITFALFTNDEGDGKIGINTTAGKVRVDIINENQDSLVGDVLDFIDPDSDGEILFEPGATFHTEGFRIKNTGTVPINFRAYISEDSDQDNSAFNEAFEFWITKDLQDLKTSTELVSFEDRLEVGQTSETYYLVVRMKKSAGNEFKNKTYSGIGITVYAVQGNVEIEETK